MSKNPPIERVAFSIDEFCESAGISRSYFYTMSDAERPRTIKRGRRVLIPADAVKAWLAAPAVA